MHIDLRLRTDGKRAFTRTFMSLSITVAATLAVTVAATGSLTNAAVAHGDDEGGFNQAAARPSEIKVDALASKSLGIATTAASVTQMKNYMRATGEVQAAETQAFDVNAPVSGVVQNVGAKQGDFVKKGQILSSIYSTEVANSLTQLVNDNNRTSSELARVKAQYESDITLQENQLAMAELAFGREKDLLKEGITARKTYQEAENNLRSAQVKLSTLKSRLKQESDLVANQLKVSTRTSKGQLKIMGISNAQVEQSLKTGKVTADLDIIAPVSGYVTTRSVTQGERVESARKLFSIVNLSPIWVMVDIYQEQLAQVHVGDKVLIETPAKENLEGTISSVGSVVDATTKTLHVRIVTDNKKGVLRPGMFVTAQILVGEGAKQAITVPESSVVYQNEVPYVYVLHQKEGSYQPVAVKLGGKNGSDVEIVSGIHAGDIVVSSGADQLRAQSNFKEATSGSADNHSNESHDDHSAHEAEVTHQSDPKVAQFVSFALGALAATVVLAGGLTAFKLSRKKDKQDKKGKNDSAGDV
jgi:cobalt-zinc-cadmium efflux system membrane fusion protein